MNNSGLGPNGISVIIPVYNSEGYLRRCIESVRRQTFSRLEIILVDDGSSDRSGDICDEFSEKDERIRCIHKKHEGLPAARKTGTQEAVMDLLSFVDSDDWIEPDMLRMLLSLYSDDIGLITSGLKTDFKDHEGNMIDAFASGVYDDFQISQYVISKMMYSTKHDSAGIVQSVCGKIFKTEILKDSINDLDDRLTWGEDGAIVYPYVLQIRKLQITHLCGYHYVVHDDSMINTVSCGVFEKIAILNDYLSRKMVINDRIMKPQIDDYIFSFLQSATFNIYKIGIHRFNSETAFSMPCLPPKSKVVLYGAGIRGEKIADRILGDKEWKLVAWVDRDYVRINSEKNTDMPIGSPNEICDLEYDYVLISVSKTSVVNEIKEWLDGVGIEREKVIIV